MFFYAITKIQNRSEERHNDIERGRGGGGRGEEEFDAVLIRIAPGYQLAGLSWSNDGHEECGKLDKIVAVGKCNLKL